jgi:hypothetical protein
MTTANPKDNKEESIQGNTEENENVADEVQNDVVIDDNLAQDAPISEAPEEYYYCNDGESIPLAFYNDGGCDCSSCEDEN